MLSGGTLGSRLTPVGVATTAGGLRSSSTTVPPFRGAFCVACAPQKAPQDDDGHTMSRRAPAVASGAVIIKAWPAWTSRYRPPASGLAPAPQ
jgi:hypothetical protein